MFSGHVRRLVCLATTCLTLASAAPALAQYFGRNKVPYKKLDFQVLKTEHFDIYFYPQEREGVDIAARMAERWLVRLERLLDHQLRGRQPLVLYAAHPDFEQNNVIQGEIGEGTGGVTEPLRRRIVLPFGGPLADTDHVIGHELVHAFQFDITTRPNAPPGQNGAERLPLWFIEGMAEYLSIGPVDANTAMWLRDAARLADTPGRKDALPSIKDLDNPKYFPYRWGQAFWAYVGGRFGDDVIPLMLSAAAAVGDTDTAIEKVLGIKTAELSDDWRASIRLAYARVLAETTPPSETGRLVIKGTGLGGDVNVGPAISPDGRWLAFLSTRSVFSTDLFIANAETGKIVRKLTSTASDRHLSSIEFIYSAGAWDASSQRIALATVTQGRSALAIFAAQSGKKEREVPLPQVDEIFNPTWAPDGHAVCFTGMSRGLTDLYVYDLNASALRRLTNDAYADLQPAWSPDGRRIAFATDRFSSDLRALAFDAYRLALVDAVSGVITPLPAFTVGKNINPQWTPDGRALVFISDRDGIPNLYRTTIADGEVRQLTNVGTGVSGITSSSPALSVAARSGVAAFSVYEGGKYDIYVSGVARGTPPLTLSINAGVLPPIDRRPSDVLALLTKPTLGLPPPREYPVQPYKARLTLEGVAQPSITLGAGRFGTSIGGGVAFQFADMLGDHLLATTLDLNSGLSNNFSLKNTAAQVLYVNQAHRWNWGVVAGQIPYLSGGFQSAIGTIQGEPVEVDQSIIFRQTEQSAAAIVAYPLNRAQRIEFQAGVTRVSFDQIVETTAFSLVTGNVLRNDSATTPLGEPLRLGTTSAALVFDTANFGATSPVQGQRYRLEATPTFGSLQYTSVLADYRRYVMPVAFYTIAIRAMHYGRYGGGGEDSRLFPLYVGYPDLVRGYDVDTLESAECVASAAGPCPLIDRLTGSRFLVGNVEFRFPLLRPFGASQRMYGPIPVEVAFFADGGVAWNHGEKPSFLGGSRNGIGSGGITFRVNLLGFAVGEFDIARPFQRPGRGWVYQFNLSPGF